MKERDWPSLKLYLKDLGYGATFSSNVIFTVFEQLSIYPVNAPQRLTDLEISACLAMMAQTHTGLYFNPTLMTILGDILDDKSKEVISQMKTWNVELFFPLVCKMNPKLDWNFVLKYLDHPETSFFDSNSLVVVLKASKAVLQDMSLFPTKIFIARWNNKPAQIQFLTEAVKIAPEIFTMCKSINRFVVTKETFPMNNATRFFINGSMQSCWNSMDLIELLIEYSANAKSPAESCSALIEVGLDQAPDLLLLAFSMLNAPWSGLVKDLAPKLVIAMISGHIHSQIVLPKVWEMNPMIVIAGFILMYLSDNTSLSRILDVSQDLKALTRVLEAKPFTFAIDLAALASRREYLNLEKWLQDRIRKEGEGFVRASLDFLNEKMTAMSTMRADMKQTVPLTSNVAMTFARVLHSFRAEMSPDVAEYCDKTLVACNQLIPRMEASDEQPGDTTSFPHDIEEEANSFFEKIYKGELSIPQVIDHLQRLKMSPNPREQETFKCMIHNLFDEYKFFARYPDRELLITGILFGVLIQNQLVTSMALGIALRYVLEALRQPAGSKLFQFGVQALAQFQDRLPEWPQYCALLLQIEHLHQTLPEVVHLISSIQNQQTAPPGELMSHNASLEDQSSLFKALQLRGILQEPFSINFDVPNEQVQDKILFIINNVAVANLTEKVANVMQMLSPQHVRWFCHYIVVKRASIEPNFHTVYVAFMDQMPIPNIEANLLFETLSSIKNLLNSEKTVNSSQERSYLKNLGAWLGAISLAKNKPIKHKNLAFKELLLEGYEHKRLIVVIPFVCKVLEQSSSSQVFHPPNPWIMAIMRLLAELYHFADLKLNLKFEIEVLCKNIKLDIKDIEPCNILRNRIANPNPTGTMFSGRRGPDGNAQEEPQGAGLPNLAQFIVFNPNITLFNTHPNLKRIVHIAIDRSIREVIQSPVVERSVTIAIVATREIVQKDFALEPNEEKMRKAAQSMVQSLSGSLASVSSREPLKVSMISNLRTLLAANGFTEQTIPEQLIFVIVSDNLDLACSVMEKAAAEKSIPEIDESLMTSYVARKKHREQRTGQAFYDPIAYGSSRYLSALPESLRLRPGGLAPSQLNVYEDFLRIHQPQPPAESGDRNARARQDTRSDAGSDTSGLFSLPQAIEKFNSVVQDLDRLITENGNSTLESLGSQHGIKVTVQQLFWVISQSANPDECCLLIAEKLVGYLYSNSTSLAKEVYILILRRFFDLSKTLPKELKEWFLYNEDVRKYDAEIYSAVIKADIVAPHEVDLHLARLIEHNPENMSFAIELINSSCLQDAPICVYTDFLYTIACIKKALNNGEDLESGRELIERIEERTALKELSQLYTTNQDMNSVEVRKVLGLVFEEWVEIASHLGTSVQTQLNFVSELMSQNIICTEQNLPLFIRICVELGIQSAMTVKSENIAALNPYVAIDALARFVVLLLKTMKSDESFTAASILKIAQKVFSVVSVVLVFAHEKTQVRFDQKPFFRFFSSLLNDLKEFQFDMQNIYYSVLCLFSNTLFSLSPQKVPGFSFSWVQLLCHRNFLPPLLLCDNQKCWPFFHKLLVEYFTFLAPQLQHSNLNNTSRVLYRATLRILLILLHDFPEFLTSYHHSLVNAIPVNCIQLRNLILSAFPTDMRLPDPFTPNLKVDLLPEINQAPKMLSNYTQILIDLDIKTNLDKFLEKRTPASYPNSISKHFLNKNPVVGNKYNVPLINSFVLYTGIFDILQSQEKNDQGAPQVTPNSPVTDLYQRVLAELEPEGRYLFISAMANQLRFPNSHTHYFSCMLLYLFSENKNEFIKEQITRTLIERLIVSRPHPYGLLITFIELIRNPRYSFWDHTNFINSAPEIERLFQNVAKSMSQSMPTQVQ